MSNELNRDDLKILVNKFFSCYPIKELNLETFITTLSWEQQEFLVNSTVNSDLIKKYPSNFSYQKIFLKSIIEILEKNYIEVHDTLYSTYCDILNINEAEKFYFKHYLVNEEVITLKENKNYISEGTTGLCSWQASLMLSQWCLNNKDKFKNQTILELGSGIGLVGLTLNQCCQPSKIFLTDCHPKVLSVLCENIVFNLKQVTLSDTERAIKFCDKFDSIASDDSIISCTVKETFGTRYDSDKIESRANNVVPVNDKRGNTVKLNLSDKFVNNCETNIFKSDSLENICKARSINDIKQVNCDGGLIVLGETVTNNRESCSDTVVNQRDTVKNSNKSHSNEFFDSIVLLRIVKNNCETFVVNLPWENIEQDNRYSTISPDIILAADVVYDSSVFDILCATLKYFSARNSTIQIIFACTERNSDTLQDFQHKLDYYNFKTSNLTIPDSTHFFWSNTVPIRLFLITAK